MRMEDVGHCAFAAPETRDLVEVEGNREEVDLAEEPERHRLAAGRRGPLAHRSQRSSGPRSVAARRRNEATLACSP